MSDQTPLWISEADVVSLMSLGDAINALESGLLAEASGDARNMTKTHVTWGKGSTLHAIGAVFAKDGFVGTKTWAHTEGGATPLLILFDSGDGSLKAVIEAFALGQMRTGGASAVATRRLAAEDADELAIIGAGKQAGAQVAAVAAVRPIRRIRVFGRNEERRAKLVAWARREFGVEAVAAGSVAEAVAEAPIITVVTRATEPILFAGMVSRGAHINAVGAITPERAEIALDTLERCDQVVVDTIPSAQRLSRELIEYFGAAASGWAAVKSLASVVAAGQPRSASDDLTLFKSLGMGISDLALGIELYRRARQRGLGRGLAHPQKAAPRWR
ncbi:MAG TPA: ornithine cyclodeaminase family protein [Blastocatellia bacterium]|nr:ornithine cyclodeaminase family protein [Blastocatellia bacterium]